MEHFDVIIVGAGISGIGAAYHLQQHCRDRSYAILEGRADIGGTWDLFRYPGIRSDSDMYTLGYAFRPWTEAKAIADGPAILKYVKETAAHYAIDRHIRFRHHVKTASWSTETATWTVTATGASGEEVRFSCNFLFMCSGYYNYAKGHAPDFAGSEDFAGQIVHPQFWPEDIDYTGKRVVVIGSGATAVTLVPELAKQAAHVTMLQRSPTYIVSVPAIDPLAKYMPRGAARWKNVLFGMGFYAFCRRYPARARRWIIGQVRKQLPAGYDLSHFTPSYNPWDQRLCLVPDADLFRSVREGKASVVTDHIETFTEHGIKLRSGEYLPADLVVTATGLRLKFLAGMKVDVDGAPIEPASLLVYKGMMLSGVPNLAFAVGYTNASWTLKCDLTSRYVCRLLNHMQAKHLSTCTPRRDPSVEELPLIDFSSGYVTRSLHELPRQGKAVPWRLYQNYALDLATLRHGRIDDPAMQFS